MAADRHPRRRTHRRGTAAYLRLPDGTGRSKLAARSTRLAPVATGRNWRTVTALAALARDR